MSSSGLQHRGSLPVMTEHLGPDHVYFPVACPGNRRGNRPKSDFGDANDFQTFLKNPGRPEMITSLSANT